jgi:hypothetical protein
MAVYTYGANDIAWSSFDDWSNQFASQANLSLNTLMDNLEPADSAPHAASELRSNSFLYGTVIAETGGTVSVTSGYTQAAASSFTLRNVNFASIASITITATATYPYTFHSFRTAASGGGSVLSSTGQGTTTGTFTVSSGTATGTSTFYAYFTTTHVAP